MKNKKILIASILIIGIFLIGITSAYFCYNEEDNKEVQEFKSKINCLALKNDLNSNMTPEAINLKLKYFSNCKQLKIETQCLSE